MVHGGEGRSQRPEGEMTGEWCDNYESKGRSVTESDDRRVVVGGGRQMGLSGVTTGEVKREGYEIERDGVDR